MIDNEKSLLDLIRNNDERVAEYMLSLFLDYLRTHAPSQERDAALRVRLMALVDSVTEEDVDEQREG